MTDDVLSHTIGCFPFQGFLSLPMGLALDYRFQTRSRESGRSHLPWVWFREGTQGVWTVDRLVEPSG